VVTWIKPWEAGFGGEGGGGGGSTGSRSSQQSDAPYSFGVASPGGVVSLSNIPVSTIRGHVIGSCLTSKRFSVSFCCF
jgi:hypothetical protein